MMSHHSRRLSVSFAVLAISALALAGCANGGAAEESTDDSRPTAELNEEIQAMLPERIREDGAIVVGTEAYYPPYEYFADDDTTIIGLDPDLLHALGDVLGVEMKVENMAYDGLLPALDSKRLDMVTAAVSINEERIQKYDFVSYFNTPQGITVPADNPHGIESQEDLCGLNVSVLDASHQQRLLEEMNENVCADDPATIMAFTADSDALQQIQNGRADAHLAQYPVASFNAAQFGGGETFLAISDESFGPSILGHVFRKDDPELRDAVQAGLNDLIESGIYFEILESHGLEVGALERSQINQLS